MWIKAGRLMAMNESIRKRMLFMLLTAHPSIQTVLWGSSTLRWKGVLQGSQAAKTLFSDL